MNNTAKHTPGPLHTRKPSLGQPCTCCILLRTGEPLESIHGDRTCSDISRIELCPLHAAAPAMYEALQAIVQSCASRTYKEVLHTAEGKKLFLAYEQSCKALAQAEGK